MASICDDEIVHGCLFLLIIFCLGIIDVSLVVIICPGPGPGPVGAGLHEGGVLPGDARGEDREPAEYDADQGPWVQTCGLCLTLFRMDSTISTIDNTWIRRTKTILLCLIDNGFLKRIC